jgi:uncharacterized protein
VNGFEILRDSARRRVPWLNGGGWTTEIIAWPNRDSWEWRLSVADVDTAGPFSEFPGVDRTIAMLHGNGMILTMDGTENRIDRPLVPFTFSGDYKTTCALIDGPVQDLNLMVRRQAEPKRLDFVNVEESIELFDFELALVIQGTARVDGVLLDPLDAVFPLAGTSPSVLISPASSEPSILAVVRPVGC